MSIFKRLKDVTLSNMNALLDRAEDPEKLLDQYLLDMEKDMKDAETNVAQQISIEKKFKKQLDDAVEMRDKRRQQAEKALEKEDEDLARRALEDKNKHQEKVDELTPTHENAKQSSRELRDQLDDMKNEYEKMKAKKETLKARASSAKAQQQINESMSGFGSDNASAGFDRMSEKVDELEARAETSKEMRDSGNSLDDELDALDKNDVDDELAQMKAKMKEKNNG
ncbi:PspA/IM30 family protein [Salibacterium halotolerans]|uniref:Phage shock protein A n=1 Tax=Salibacterium halotolerans TaxID=1884432 RepID=A0A1I5S4X4_9BACI|nr:PspA/IM30 family protein [Salibacterium halotolerans]SFP65717.1 phage shock protein A [Salibacterium halotolerans]